MALDEIIVMDYDPAWPERYAAEAARLRAALGSGMILRMEHVGSTAVPGLAAKPVIDILIGVASLDEARREAVPRLEEIGYAYWRDNPDPARLFFARGLPPNGPRTHHVHIAEVNAPAARRDWDKLVFRDYLRSHPDEAGRYAAVKRELAGRFRSDREAYTEGKSEYILGVLAIARAG